MPEAPKAEQKKIADEISALVLELPVAFDGSLDGSLSVSVTKVPLLKGDKPDDG